VNNGCSLLPVFKEQMMLRRLGSSTHYIVFCSLCQDFFSHQQRTTASAPLPSQILALRMPLLCYRVSQSQTGSEQDLE
jgi:hypothetical protein